MECYCLCWNSVIMIVVYLDMKFIEINDIVGWKFIEIKLYYVIIILWL